MKAIDWGEHSEPQRPQPSLVGAPKRRSFGRAGLPRDNFERMWLFGSAGRVAEIIGTSDTAGCWNVRRGNGGKVGAVFLAGTPIVHGPAPSRLLGFADSPQPVVLHATAATAKHADLLSRVLGCFDRCLNSTHGI